MTTVPSTHDYTVPSSAAAGNTNVEIATSYATCTSHTGICPLTYTLYKSTNVLYAGTFLQMNTGTGQLTVDTDVLGNEDVYFKITHASGNFNTNTFNVKNVCNTLALTTVPHFNMYVPATPSGAYSNVAIVTSYYTMTSQPAVCPITFSLLDSGGSGYASGFLTHSGTG